MALKQSEWALGRKQMPVSREAGGVVAARVEFDTAGVTLALGDIIEIGGLPAYHGLVDAILDCDDLDTNVSPAMALNVGIMSGNYQVVDDARTCGEEMFSASTLPQAGGIARMSLQTGFRIDPVGYDRGIGVEIDAAAATAAATGKIALILFYKQ